MRDTRAGSNSGEEPAGEGIIRVLVAVKEPLVAAGVQATLDEDTCCRLVATVGTLGEVRPAVQEHRPHVLLMGSGLQRERPELVRELADDFPDCRTIIMVDHDLEECILRAPLPAEGEWRFTDTALETLNECCLVGLRNAARGCVPKSASRERLVTAVETVAAGQMAAHEWLSAMIGRHGDDVDTVSAISARELELIRLVADGHSNRAIARRLDIQEQTVKNRLSRVNSKLKVRNRLELAIYALKHNLV